MLKKSRLFKKSIDFLNSLFYFYPPTEQILIFGILYNVQLISDETAQTAEFFQMTGGREQNV